MEQLITISEDSPTRSSIIPKDDGTLPFLKYITLTENPYKFSELEFFKEVHHIIRKKTHLKVDSYSIKRMHLVKKYGWGVHINAAKKIALIPCDSDKYTQLLDDEDIQKLKAYRNKKMV